ncbi:MAG: MlaE family ABC transporter permease [Cyclobacteriaceae bacterium]
MHSLGKYFLFLKQLFTNRERFSIYVKLFFEEAISVGFNSLFIVSIISFFLGAVSVVQVAYQLTNPFLPKYIIGTLIRDLSVLELSPSIISIVLAGKVGSNIAGGLGTMRVTEQIDALEVMGINSISYLVLPKIVAALITFPILVILSEFLLITGGYLAGTYTDALTPYEYIYGLRYEFIPFNIFFGLIKAFVFAFLISSISSYKGYYTKGGALEVGIASTSAVTTSCIAILVADFLLAKLIL